jgi:hypothetical protein
MHRIPKTAILGRFCFIMPTLTFHDEVWYNEGVVISRVCAIPHMLFDNLSC